MRGEFDCGGQVRTGLWLGNGEWEWTIATSFVSNSMGEWSMGNSIWILRGGKITSLFYVLNLI